MDIHYHKILNSFEKESQNYMAIMSEFISLTVNKKHLLYLIKHFRVQLKWGQMIGLHELLSSLLLQVYSALSPAFGVGQNHKTKKATTSQLQLRLKNVTGLKQVSAAHRGNWLKRTLPKTRSDGFDKFLSAFSDHGRQNHDNWRGLISIVMPMASLTASILSINGLELTFYDLVFLNEP